MKHDEQTPDQIVARIIGADRQSDQVANLRNDQGSDPDFAPALNRAIAVANGDMLVIDANLPSPDAADSRSLR